MEKFAEDKISKVHAIKKKYKELELAINGQENLNQAEISQIKEEMDRNMKKEIDDIQLEIQRERKEKITELRNRYE
jgi:isopropylmalate/homocitrate/citramalate synthase